MQVHFRDNGKNIVVAGDFCVEDIIEDDFIEDDGNNTLNNNDDYSTDNVDYYEGTESSTLFEVANRDLPDGIPLGRC